MEGASIYFKARRSEQNPVSEARLAIFQNFIMSDVMSREGQHAMFFRGLRHNGREKVQVRRGMVALDGFDRLRVDLKPIEISLLINLRRKSKCSFSSPSISHGLA